VRALYAFKNAEARFISRTDCRSPHARLHEEVAAESVSYKSTSPPTTTTFERQREVGRTGTTTVKTGTWDEVVRTQPVVHSNSALLLL
jgi:hypothetical protein